MSTSINLTQVVQIWITNINSQSWFDYIPEREPKSYLFGLIKLPRKDAYFRDVCGNYYNSLNEIGSRYFLEGEEVRVKRSVCIEYSNREVSQLYFDSIEEAKAYKLQLEEDIKTMRFLRPSNK